MKTLFKDILALEDVKGVVFLGNDGQIRHREVAEPLPRNLEEMPWQPHLQALGDVKEADLVFEDCRIYLRRTDTGFLLVYMGLFVPMAMVRLNCDLVLPSLNQAPKPKGIRRFFKR